MGRSGGVSLRGLRVALRNVLLVLVGVVALLFTLVRVGLIPDPFGPSVSGDVALARSSRAGLRVLFVGNSLTYTNGMPSLVRRLAVADPGPRRLFVVQYTRPGGRLEQAARDDRLTTLLRDVHWNAVVLQEQSEIPSLPLSERRKLMDAAATDLAWRAASSGARAWLFATWGYRSGDRGRVHGDSYAAMQARLDQGYRDVAAEAGAAVVPVGDAWAVALARRPGLELWNGDGKHPTKLGSYLAACVFYEFLTHRPAPSYVPAGVSGVDGAFLRKAATTIAEREGALRRN